MPDIRFQLAVVAIVAGLVSTAAAQGATAPAPLRVGDTLPRLEGEFLTGRDAALPAAAAGKVTLVLMGFTYASRLPVEAWGAWFRKAVGTREGVTFFEVPMLGSFARVGRWFIDSGMRKGTPAELHENVITVYSGTGDWKRRLGHSSANEDTAFLILLDRNGTVRWLHSGEFEAARAEELKGTITSLTADPSAPGSSGQ